VRRIALFGLGVAALAMSGCAGLAGGAADASGGPPAVTTYWSGRFAISVTESGHEPKEERASGRFVLEASRGSTVLELFSPLGQTLASATINERGARLVASDGKIHEAGSAESLTEQVIGWRVPVGDLPRWLRGEIDRPTEWSAGRAVSGMERGWTIRMENWQPAGPRRLALDRADPADRAERRISVRLIVDDAH
jgi:outer membrane lipoprotein LolB